MPTRAFDDNRTEADLEALIELGKHGDIEAYMDRLSPSQKARAISWLGADAKAKLVGILGPETFACILTEITGLGA